MKLDNNTYYLINPFIEHELPNSNIVMQNRDGVIIIKDEKIKRALPMLEKEMGKRIPLSNLKVFFQDNLIEYTDFMIQNNIIKKVTPPNFNIEKVHFFSNLDTIHELMSRSFSHYSDIWSECNDIEMYCNLIKKNKNELFVVFLNPYDKKIAHKLRDLFLLNENTLSIMSYIYNGNFYFESIYSAKWKTPCHICQFSHIESEYRRGVAYGFTYQQLIDYLYELDNNFKVSTPIDFNDALNISTQLVNRLNLLLALRLNVYINSMEEFTKGLVMDMNKRSVQLDTTHHWELCDCYV